MMIGFKKKTVLGAYIDGQTCYCHKCKRQFNPLGIMRHRAMHRDHGEDCKITYTNGNTVSHTGKSL